VIQALSFDAAGTLIEPSEPVAETYARLLSPHLGSLEPDAIREAFPRAFARADPPDYERHENGHLAEQAWWRGVVEATLGQAVSDEAFETVFDHYAQGNAWRAFEEVGAVLGRCHELGLRCVVISNFDRRLHAILSDLGLTDGFEHIVTSADARARKPSSGIFANALGQLDLDAGRILHVGDSEQADFQGAAATGIRSYLLQRPTNDLRDFLRWVETRRGI
jgi:putative hydrolase of the HAD superfamily